MVIPLRSDAAVETLKSGGQVYVEVDVALAVGPLGRSVGTSVNGRTWPGEQVSVDVVSIPCDQYARVMVVLVVEYLYFTI